MYWEEEILSLCSCCSLGYHCLEDHLLNWEVLILSLCSCCSLGCRCPEDHLLYWEVEILSSRSLCSPGSHCAEGCLLKWEGEVSEIISLSLDFLFLTLSGLFERNLFFSIFCWSRYYISRYFIIRLDYGRFLTALRKLTINVVMVHFPFYPARMLSFDDPACCIDSFSKKTNPIFYDFVHIPCDKRTILIAFYLL